MAAGHSPTMRRRRLASELRRLRDAAKLTNEQLASRLGWSTAKLSRYENARQRPDVGEIMDLLDALDVNGSEHDRLVTLAREANARGWWRAFGDDISARQRSWAELEAGAVQIHEYRQMLVPALLQTPDYARTRLASMRAVGGDRYDREVEVVARATRQEILVRPDPARYEVILDEAVLRRRGCSAEVLRGQFQRLVAVAAMPNVSLRLLPFGLEVDQHYVPCNSFASYRFSDPEDPEIVVIETETSDLHLGDDEDVTRYRLAFDRFRAAALPSAESAAFIADLVESV